MPPFHPDDQKEWDRIRSGWLTGADRHWQYLGSHPEEMSEAERTELHLSALGVMWRAHRPLWRAKMWLRGIRSFAQYVAWNERRYAREHAARQATEK